jgi:hypothetical protein
VDWDEVGQNDHTEISVIEGGFKRREEDCRERRMIGGGVDIRYEAFPDLKAANAIYLMPIISSSQSVYRWRYVRGYTDMFGV